MKNLFEKTNLGKIELKNRFVRSATWENMTTEEGFLTEDIYTTYEELAQGGLGLLITGYANIVEEEQPNPGMFGIYSDKFIPGYKKLTDLVHQYNTKIILQVAYGGTKTKYNVGKRIIFAPSNVPELSTGTLGTPMTKEDINYIINAFKESAIRAKKSGFDGIEIHGAHTYLINQFLSPYYNTRKDEYGGSLENRMRFLVEIYTAMREGVGDFPILVKLTSSEFFEGGLTFDETRIIAKKMEELGVDAIELSGNVHGRGESLIGQSFDGFEIPNEGYFSNFGKALSQEISIPIITVGGLKTFDKVNEIFNSSNIAFFGISRPLLTEPDLINKWEKGERGKVKCIRCSKCRRPDGNYCIFVKRHR